jgi:hypothetical protein
MRKTQWNSRELIAAGTAPTVPQGVYVTRASMRRCPINRAQRVPMSLQQT